MIEDLYSHSPQHPATTSEHLRRSRPGLWPHQASTYLLPVLFSLLPVLNEVAADGRAILLLWRRPLQLGVVLVVVDDLWLSRLTGWIWTRNTRTWSLQTFPTLHILRDEVLSRSCLSSVATSGAVRLIEYSQSLPELVLQ